MYLPKLVMRENLFWKLSRSMFRHPCIFLYTRDLTISLLNYCSGWNQNPAVEYWEEPIQAKVFFRHILNLKTECPEGNHILGPSTDFFPDLCICLLFVILKLLTLQNLSQFKIIIRGSFAQVNLWFLFKLNFTNGIYQSYLTWQFRELLSNQHNYSTSSKHLRSTIIWSQLFKEL